MKTRKILSAIFSINFIAFTLLSSCLAQAQQKKYDAGVAVQIGDGTSFGIQGKVGVTDNISIRPEFLFGTGSELEIRQGSGVLSGLKGRSSGTTYGVAATYDLNLDPQGKSIVYIGPKFSLSSGSVSASGNNINVNEAKIGLMVGSDYQISNDFVIGANVTYNLSRSLSYPSAIGNIILNDAVKSNGSALEFGIRASYRF